LDVGVDEEEEEGRGGHSTALSPGAKDEPGERANMKNVWLRESNGRQRRYSTHEIESGYIEELLAEAPT
jgi:hypothetical protein